MALLDVSLSITKFLYSVTMRLGNKSWNFDDSFLYDMEDTEEMNKLLFGGNWAHLGKRVWEKSRWIEVLFHISKYRKSSFSQNEVNDMMV
jgi:hypothetical protein